MLDASRVAAENSLKMLNTVAPIIVVENSRGEIELGIIGTMTREGKVKVGQAIQHALAKGARSVVFTSEAWLSTIDKEKSPALFQGIVDGVAVIMPPKNDPERKEGILIQLYTPDRQVVIGAERDGRTLKEWKVIGDTADANKKIKRTTF